MIQYPFPDKALAFVAERKTSQKINTQLPEIQECAKYPTGDLRHVQEPTVKIDKADGYKIISPPQEVHNYIQLMAKEKLIMQTVMPRAAKDPQTIIYVQPKI